jgi:hypothetical protein
MVLPPFDEKAAAPNKVYNCQLMAGDEAWSRISRVVDKVIKSAEEDGVKDQWVSNLLTRGRPNVHIPESIKELLSAVDPFIKKSHIFRVKATFFLFLLMRFHHKINQKKRIFGDPNECIAQTRSPPEVGARLLELFMSPLEGTSDEGYSCSRHHMDKLHAYILVLYAIASGNEIKAPSVNQLCKDLKLDEKQAMAVYREAGFTVKKNGVDISVSLSVPLTFPPPKRGKK